MNPANNIFDFARNLNPSEYISEKNKEFYVPVFDEILQSLRQQIIINENREEATFYIAGQVGTGKTSALNFLADEELKKKYVVEYIHGREFFDLNDIDIIDILLVFSFLLIQKHPDLQKKYFKELDRIQKTKNGILEEETEKSKSKKKEAGAGSKIGFGASVLSFVSMGVDAFANYKMDRQFRNIIREKFQIKKLDLLNLANNIITDYYEKFGTDKKLLVVFDDLEKIRNIDQIRSIFIDNRSYFRNIKCKKIISFPISLCTEEDFLIEDTNPEYFGLRLKENKFTKGKQATRVKHNIEDNRKVLHQIVKKRTQEGVELIDMEAIDKAIDFSGGLLRQFIKLLYTAATHASRYADKNSKVTVEDVEYAIDDEKDTMARAIISTSKINMLKEIMDKNKPVTDDNEMFIKAILGNQVIIYQNGDPWYDVNPIIAETVMNYSE